MIFIIAILLFILLGGVLFWFFKPKSYRHSWFIIIFGLPGSGKSLEQASMSYDFFKDYLNNEKKYPDLKTRILCSNQKLKLGVISNKLKVNETWLQSRFLLWKQPEDFRYCPRKNCWEESGLHPLHDADLIVDEGALLFPADAWADTPYWLRELLKEHRHRGIRMRVLTQTYEDIVVHARRVCRLTLYMEKSNLASRDISASLPPINRVWGFYYTQEISPVLIGNDSKAILNMKLSPEDLVAKYAKANLLGRKSFHWISRFKISLYDTTQKVDHYEPKYEIEHIEGFCTRPNCGYKHIKHKVK